jgi:hypothetical protein
VVIIVTAVVGIYNRERDWSIVNVIILPQLGHIARLNVTERPIHTMVLMVLIENCVSLCHNQENGEASRPKQTRITTE